MFAPKGTQNEPIHAIVNELYSNPASEATAFYYIHNKKYENITQVPCIDKLQKNIEKELLDYERVNNVTLLRHKVLGHYLTDSEDIQNMFTVTNGTIMLIELVGNGKALYDRFPDVETQLSKAINESCTPDELKAVDHGALGLAKFLVDARKSISL